MSILKNKYFILFAFTLFILLISFVRPVNIDESYYIASAQELLTGKLLYKDFIFHQMPLTIYIYSVISDFGFWSLLLGRTLSVLMISISCLLLISLVKRISGNTTIYIFLILFFLNSFFIDWSILVRIYALSILLLSLGIFYFDKFLRDKYNSTYLFLSVLAFTLLVFTKVTFIASYIVIIVFILIAVTKNINKNLYKNIFITIIASVIPPLIFLIIFGKYLEEFYFNILQVNFITKEYIDAPFTISLLKYLSYFLLPQNLILLVIILISGFKYSFFEKLLIVNILCFTLIHIPSRMLTEYLCTLTPLLVLLSCLRYEKFVVNIITKYRSFSSKHIYVSLIFIYILSAPFGVIHLKNIIEGTELLMNPVQLYTFEQKVNSLPGNTVLSSWEGYSIFSEKLPFLKEQYGGAFINKYVGEKDILKYNIAQHKDYENLILNKTPDIIIFDNSNSAYLDSMVNLISNNYNKAFEYQSVDVYCK